MKVKKAVIPLGGFGMHWLPVTKAQPKEMLPILNRPTLAYIIDEACDSGIEEILLITGRNEESIVNYFDRSLELEEELKRSRESSELETIRTPSDKANIYFMRQKETLRFGYAVLQAKEFIGDEPFAVLSGDDVIHAQVPVIKQLIKAYNQVEASVVGVQKIPYSMVNQYGMIDGEKDDTGLYLLRSVIEKPPLKEAPSNIAILGRYIFTPEIFSVLGKTVPDKNGEIQLTDGIMGLILREKVYAYSFEGRRYDMSHVLGFLEGMLSSGLSDPEIGKAFYTYLENLMNRL